MVRVTANVLIGGLWLWLYRPVFDYLAIIFSRDDFRTNQLALIGVVALIVVRARTSHPRLQIDAAPRLFLPGLALALGGSALYLAIERLLDINTISASLFGLATYGLLGLWMQPRRFWEGLPAVALLIGTLPFGEHMQTFIGYPMRILTATIVRDGLGASGVASVGVDTILVLENSVSQIDLPCSGVKSLWAGLLFLIAATWVERRPLNWRWGLVALALAGLLFAANLARVGILVVVGQVAGWRMVADMLHIPLGVLGFGGACAAAVALLQLRRPDAGSSPPPLVGGVGGGGKGNAGGYSPPPNPPHQGEGMGAPASAKDTSNCMIERDESLPRPVWLSPCLAAAILAMAVAYAPHSQTGLTQPPPTWAWPGGLVTDPIPLEPDEIEWLKRDGAESAQRWRFEWRAIPEQHAISEWRSITGTLTLITSEGWRAHHSPERCLTLNGLSIDDSRTYLVAPDFPLRLVSLSDGQRSQSAAYWFQSAGQTTDDYATRIWADLTPGRRRWVMVSIVFDGAYDPHAADIQALYPALHTVVAHSLRGGIQ